MNDFMPDKEGDLIIWTDNFSDKIEKYAKTLGFLPDDVTQMKSACTGIDSTVKASAQALAESKKAVEAKVSTVRKSEDLLRTKIGQAKKSDGYTKEIGEDLKIIGTDDPFDPDTYKTTLTATVFPGRVSIKFTKKRVQGVNIYSQLKGEEKWEKLACDSYSPYEDNRPLHVPGTAEVRQYMAIGVIHDHEIGQMSDIIEVTFGG